jgi:general secretion pathway protein D
MKTLPRLCLLCLVSAPPALWAQTPPPPPLRPGARNPPNIPPANAAPLGGAKTIAPTVPAGPKDGTAIVTPVGERKTPTCEEVRHKARYNIYFDKVDIEKLVQTVSDATCKTFILPESVRGKISIIGPENGKVEVDADQFFGAFLAALDVNNLNVTPYGKFLKIIDKRQAKQSTIPTIIDPDEVVTTNEQMVTKLFRIKYADIEQIRGVLQQLVTKDGDTLPFQPDLIIVNDLGSNMHRLERIIEQLDRRSAADEIRVIQIKYAVAQDVADKISKLFESKAQKPGQRPGAITTPPPPGQTPPAAPATESGPTGPATLTQIIPDERTNKLVIIASPTAFERIAELISALDIPTVGGGYINVYYLANANAEDVASTLQSLATGTQNKPKNAPPPVAGAPKGPATAAELFQGEVKISADKSTNSLVIVASQNDYRNIVKVIEKLDITRRQVFVEAVIMEVNLDRTTTFGAGLHYGYQLSTSQGTLPIIFATKYTTQGLPPSFSIANLANFGGFLAGLQGANIPALAALGINIPQFGVVLHALQSSSDVNVLSTPHLLTTDNEEAEITVGQNVPFQAGFSPSSLGASVPGLTPPGVTPGTTGIPPIGNIFGGLGSFFAPIQRTNVDLKLTIKPQINAGDDVRLVINEQTEEIASRDPVLGPTTAKRSAKTTVVAKDQETVVLGGIMQDRLVESVSKIPILGDIPIVGHLFREESREKIKTNLLLFLTPYIIRDHSDFRRIFERKMAERQQFIEEFYGQVPGYEPAIDFGRKPGPLAKMEQDIRREEVKAENGGPGSVDERVFRPGAPPPSGAPDSAPPPPPAMPPPPPAAEGAPTPSPSSEAPPVREPPPERDRDQIRVQPPSPR